MGRYEQVLAVNYKRPMPTHLNSSIGKVISSTAQAESHLSRQSDEMSERMGFTVNYELVDPHEAPHTDAGLEATEKRAVDSGAQPAKLYL